LNKNCLYDGILFDFDGVIVDSEPVHFACWREVLLPCGIRLDWDAYREHCIGIADRIMLEFMAGQATPPVPVERLWAVYGRKQEMFVERMSDSQPVPAATRSLLEELGACRKAIVSSSSGTEVRAILRAVDIARHFSVVICGEDVSRHKPDPEPYLTAAKQLGVKNPLVVEDSAAGAESGRAAGFDVLVVGAAGETARLLRERLGQFRQG
jgi:beta-phosphoglucomutase